MTMRQDRSIEISLTPEEADAVHHALYLYLRRLSMVEDNDPDAHNRRDAVRLGKIVERAADKIKARMK
jgi:hypothetical protein